MPTMCDVYTLPNGRKIGAVNSAPFAELHTLPAGGAGLAHA